MLDFLGAIGHAIMVPLYYAVSAVLLAWHKLFSALLGEGSGWAWVLSIVGLTLVIRAALIPLFVKQIKASRNMQLIQPRVKELQEKYGHDRERFSQETMALYKETGTNPFSSCLPIFIQMPIFLALFRLLDQAARKGRGHGLLSSEQAVSLAKSELFGVPIAKTFMNAGGDVGVMVLASVLVVAMTVTTFLTQKQLMAKNMPAESLTGPFAQQQKILLYVLPLVFGIGGVAFPIGVLIYWTTSNLWTMGQQFYVIRNNPAPNTPAAAAKAARDHARAVRKGLVPAEEPEATAGDAGSAGESPVSGGEGPTRQQPRKQSRSQRKKQSGSGGASGEVS